MIEIFNCGMSFLKRGIRVLNCRKRMLNWVIRMLDYGAGLVD